MKNTQKRSLCVFLSIVMLFSLFPARAFAEGDQTAEPEIGDMTVEGTSSLGTLITRTLENENSGNQLPGTILDITVSGTTALVEFSTDRESELVAAIYPEDGIQMLGSGHSGVSAAQSSAEVPIEIDAMPEFFVVAAYLLDAESHEPLSESFISRYYTAEFQAFLATTTADYEQDLVLNLDNDPTTNFLIYSEDTLRAEETNGVNTLIDNNDGSYTVRNADERFLNLQPGDSFSYEYADGTLLIAVAASVRVDGTTVSIVEDTDATLEAVFDYIKIEEDNAEGDGWVDTSTADPGVAYLGSSVQSVESFAPATVPYLDTEMQTVTGNPYGAAISVDEDMEQIRAGAALATNVDISAGTSFSFVFDPIPNPAGSSFAPIFKGGMTFKVAAKVKIYKSAAFFSSTVKLDYSAEISVETGANFEKKFKLGEPMIPLGASGVKVSFPLYFVVEAEGTLTVGGTLKGTFGVSYDSDYGYQDLTSWPSFETKFEFAGKIFVGFEMEATVSFVVRKLIGTGIEAKIGAEIKGVLKGSRYETPGTSQAHDCEQCIEGSLAIRGTVKLKFEALFGVVKRSWTALDIKAKIADFYYSHTYNEFGWGKTCPHISYLVTIKVSGEDGKPAQDVDISIPAAQKQLKTDDRGIATVYLPSGSYTLKANKDKLSAEKEFTVLNGSKSVSVRFSKSIVGSGTCGDNLTWTLDDAGTLTISGTGALTIPGPAASPWYGNLTDIATVIIENGVTSIGDWAFWYCSSLTSVTIPESVTSIGREAFYECHSLASVTIPEGVTSIGSAAFYYCTSLRSVTIPEGVTSIGDYTFCVCSSLTSVTIPESVTSIGERAFSNCSSLTSVTIPESVRSIGDDAFSWCSSLTSVTIPESVTSIGERAFGGCRSLTSVAIPSSVTSIGEPAFCYCENLEKIDVSKKNPRYCSVDGVLFTADLKKLCTFPAAKTGTYTIPAGVTSISCYAFHVSKLTIVTIPESVTSIGTWAFYDCNSLMSVTIPSSVTSIGSFAFCSCRNLTSISISEGVTSIGEAAFSYCSSLASMTIPSSVTSIGGGAFRECSSLTSVTILEGVTSIGDAAFYDCNSLTSVTIPSSVTSIGDSAFKGCSSLADVYYGGTQEQWNSITIGSNNTSLSSATIRYEVGANASGTAMASALPDETGEEGKADSPEEESALDETLTVTFRREPEALILTVYSATEKDGNGELLRIEPEEDGSYRLLPGEYCFSASCEGYGQAVERAFTVTEETTEFAIVLSPLSVEEEETNEGGEMPEQSDGTLEEESPEEVAVRAAEKADGAMPGVEEPVEAKEAQEDGTGTEEPEAAVLLAAYAGSEELGGETRLAHFSGLVGGAPYVLLVTAGASEEDMLASDTLLYIAQGTADESGSLTLAYIPRLTAEGMTVIAYGASPKNLADAQIQVEQYLGRDFRVTVRYGDAVLTEDEDYLLFIKEGNGLVTVTVKGRGDYSGQQTVAGEMLKENVMLTGTVTAWNDSADAEVYLYAADAEDTALNAAAQSGDYSGAVLGAATLGDVTASGKQFVCAFTLADVEPGTYKLLVMKPGKYVPVIRTVTLEDDTDLGEVKLWLYGDVTDDGKVNGTDALQIKRYFADISSVFSRGTEEEQAARLIAANVTAVRTGDNKVNGTDALQIQRYFADISSVFEYMR